MAALAGTQTHAPPVRLGACTSGGPASPLASPLRTLGSRPAAAGVSLTGPVKQQQGGRRKRKTHALRGKGGGSGSSAAQHSPHIPGCICLCSMRPIRLALCSLSSKLHFALDVPAPRRERVQRRPHFAHAQLQFVAPGTPVSVCTPGLLAVGACVVVAARPTHPHQYDEQHVVSRTVLPD
jgi:hypothetical protein